MESVNMGDSRDGTKTAAIFWTLGVELNRGRRERLRQKPIYFWWLFYQNTSKLLKATRKPVYYDFLQLLYFAAQESYILLKPILNQKMEPRFKPGSLFWVTSRNKHHDFPVNLIKPHLVGNNMIYE